jgi:hypothetical protein
LETTSLVVVVARERLHLAEVVVAASLVAGRLQRTYVVGKNGGVGVFKLAFICLFVAKLLAKMFLDFIGQIASHR